MVRRSFVFLFLLITILVPRPVNQQDGSDLVNAVVGNNSVHILGVDPETLSEQERVQAHLSYVARLLAKGGMCCSNDERARRARQENLERLQRYIREGRFPLNPSDVAGRLPNFMDKRGRVCAVGYLVQQDLGRDAVVEIARRYQFDFVPHIRSPELVRWQQSSGLSWRELAMIQPTYGGGGRPGGSEQAESKPVPVLLTGWQDSGSLALVTTGVVLTLANTIQLMDSQENQRSFALAGLSVGAASWFASRYRNDNFGDTLRWTGMVGCAAAATHLFLGRQGSTEPPVHVFPHVTTDGSYGAVATIQY